MIALLFSILSSSTIYIVFKLFGKFKINSLNALVVNYFTAFLLGISGNLISINSSELWLREWIFGAVILGFLFILVFNLMIITTQRSGMSVVSVASKMSVALSVGFVIFYYDEDPGILKITGILLALVAVYLVSVKTKKGIAVKKSELIFPLLVFFGSGIIESGIKFMEAAYVAEDEVALFSAGIFAVAGIVGTIMILFRWFFKSTPVRFKDILGGIILGIPNYYSVYFFILALRSGVMPGSTVFILNNVSIVLVSTFLGIILFREKLLRKNWIGIALAVISIILVAASTNFYPG